jgi:hypothetical protein
VFCEEKAHHLTLEPMHCNTLFALVFILYIWQHCTAYNATIVQRVIDPEIPFYALSRKIRRRRRRIATCGEVIEVSKEGDLDQLTDE